MGTWGECTRVKVDMLHMLDAAKLREIQKNLLGASLMYVFAEVDKEYEKQ